MIPLHSRFHVVAITGITFRNKMKNTSLVCPISVYRFLHSTLLISLALNSSVEGYSGMMMMMMVSLKQLARSAF